MSFLFFLAAVAAQPNSVAWSELLGIDAPDEFEVAHHQRNDRAEIIELAEPPETVDNWSRLITSLIFFDAAQTGLDSFYKRWRDKLHEACPDMSDRLVRGNVDGHAAIRSTIICPKNPKTGKPENLSAFLVQGDTSIMLAQVAFRHTISPTDTALIEHVAGSLKICDQRTLVACSGRTATGFQVAR